MAESNTKPSQDVHPDKKRKIELSSFDSIVEIVAGPEKRRLMVHKRLLCQNSPYFEAAFNGNFKEASENRLELPDESSDVAEEFVFWLYTGYLSKRIKFEKTEDTKSSASKDRTTFKAETEVKSSGAEKSKPERWALLLELYIFADKRSIKTLQNRVIDAFIDNHKVTTSVWAPLIPRLYEEIDQGSPLRKLFVDWFVRYAVNHEAVFSDSNVEFYDRDFLLEVTQALCDNVKVKDAASDLDIDKNRGLYYVYNSSDHKQ